MFLILTHNDDEIENRMAIICDVDADDALIMRRNSGEDQQRKDDENDSGDETEYQPSDEPLFTEIELTIGP